MKILDYKLIIFP